VARNVKRLREAQHLTTRALQDLLTKLGRPIPASGITRIEQGSRRVDVDDLAALAIALGVRPDHLLGTSDCHVCNGTPPAGFTCTTCGATNG